MRDRKSAAIVLAAGKGTRMKSALPKVLHQIAGRSIVCHVLDRLADLALDRCVVVVGTGADQVADAVAPTPTVIQDPPQGTAHAVLAARPYLTGFDGDVLILCADTPLLTTETMNRMLEARRAPGDPAVVVLGFEPDDPAEYGRLVTDADGSLEAIVEHREATPAERRIGMCNAGIMAVDGRYLLGLLEAVDADNAKAEYYLTDIVAIAHQRGLRCSVTTVDDADEVMGINARAELAIAESVIQRRLRGHAMAQGATLIDPDSVHFSYDTTLGRDVIVSPQVFFGPGVSVGDGALIEAFCHIEGAMIAEDAIVGPFARLRPGARIGPEVKVGNFVEIKASILERGSKVNHLSYVGDTTVGAKANIGAGTITCNYDGFFKSRTQIGAGAFIGSNTSLVAPVTIGEGAITGAGSVITQDVPDDALAFERSKQTVKDGWAKSFRKLRRTKKEATRAPISGHAKED